MCTCWIVVPRVVWLKNFVPVPSVAMLRGDGTSKKWGLVKVHQTMSVDLRNGNN